MLKNSALSKILLNPQGYNEAALIEDELNFKLTDSEIHTAHLISPKKEDIYAMSPS